MAVSVWTVTSSSVPHADTQCGLVKSAYFVAYWSAPNTSIGAVVATATQVIHPEV